jgi:hypothetical protein
MRLLHIVLGVFWAGTLFSVALFLQPALRDAGPDGAKVMGGLLKRRFFDTMPIVALLTLLSGSWLYWHASNGFESAYMGSGTGMAQGIGALSAIAAFVLGVFVMRASTLRAVALGAAAAQAAPAEKEAMMAQIQALRMRAGIAGRVVAVLLLIAAAAMAVARYL